MSCNIGRWQKFCRALSGAVVAGALVMTCQPTPVGAQQDSEYLKKLRDAKKLFEQKRRAPVAPGFQGGTTGGSDARSRAREKLQQRLLDAEATKPPPEPVVTTTTTVIQSEGSSQDSSESAGKLTNAECDTLMAENTEIYSKNTPPDEMPPEGQPATFTNDATGEPFIVTAEQRALFKRMENECGGNIAKADVVSILDKPPDLVGVPVTNVTLKREEQPDGRIKVIRTTTITTLQEDGTSEVKQETQVTFQEPAVPPGQPPGVTGQNVTLVTFGRRGQAHGQYRKFADGRWIEHAVGKPDRVSARFTETQNDDYVVELHDPGRRVTLKLDVRRYKVMYSQGGSAYRPLYDILKAEKPSPTPVQVAGNANNPGSGGAQGSNQGSSSAGGQGQQHGGGQGGGSQVNATALTATQVTYGTSGQPHAFFQKVDNGEWVEYRVSNPTEPLFWYSELDKNANFILLADTSRPIALMLNFATRKIRLKHGNAPYSDFRDIVAAEAGALPPAPMPPLLADGNTATQIYYGNGAKILGRYEMINQYEWRDVVIDPAHNPYPGVSADKVPHDYISGDRSSESLYISNDLSKYKTKFDFQTRKVLQSYQLAPFVARYDIVRAVTGPVPEGSPSYPAATAHLSEEDKCLDAMTAPTRDREPDLISAAKGVGMLAADAMTMCENSEDHTATLICLGQIIGSGQSKQTAASQCRASVLFGDAPEGTTVGADAGAGSSGDEVSMAPSASGNTVPEGTFAEFCWIDSYGRGVGSIPGRVADCDTGFTNLGAGCVKFAMSPPPAARGLCPDGSVNSGPIGCVPEPITVEVAPPDCPNDYSLVGALCIKNPDETFGGVVGTIFSPGNTIASTRLPTCPSGLSMQQQSTVFIGGLVDPNTFLCRERCPSGYTGFANQCIKNEFYDRYTSAFPLPPAPDSSVLSCPDGYEKNSETATTGFCYQDCPAGTVQRPIEPGISAISGAGYYCQGEMDTHASGEATCNEDEYKVTMQMYGIDAVRCYPKSGICGDGEEQAGLCYEPCDPGYRGIGPVCWDREPNDWVNCGMGAAKNDDVCVSQVFDQVTSVGMLAVNIASFGSAGAASSAGKATKAASLKDKLKKMKDAFNQIKNNPAIKEAKKQVMRAKKTDTAARDVEDMLESEHVTEEDIARIAMELLAIVDVSGIAGAAAAYTHSKCSDITR